MASCRLAPPEKEHLFRFHRSGRVAYRAGLHDTGQACDCRRIECRTCRGRGNDNATGPVLFAAVLCSGPLLDMLRFHKFAGGAVGLPEFGSPENPQDEVILRRYSPHHDVLERIDYPPVLFVSGDSDTRCDPMRVRKMVARDMQDSCRCPVGLIRSRINLCFSWMRSGSASLRAGSSTTAARKR